MKVTLHEDAPAATAVSASAARTRRFLDGPILPALLGMALPNIVLVVVQALSSAVDGFYLGRLGPTALAGVALVFPVWMLMVTTSAGALGGGAGGGAAAAPYRHRTVPNRPWRTHRRGHDLDRARGARRRRRHRRQHAQAC